MIELFVIEVTASCSTNMCVRIITRKKLFGGVVIMNEKELISFRRKIN